MAEVIQTTNPRERKPLTLERLREVAHYEPSTGIFTRLSKTGRKGRIGSRMGTGNGSGYRTVSIEGTIYYEHRLAYFYMTGEWPKDRIDHEDENRINNRWANLREADHPQNLANTGPSKNNTTGFKGVHFYKSRQKYTADIQAYGKRFFLGYFDRAEDAAAAYAAKARELLGEFART